MLTSLATGYGTSKIAKYLNKYKRTLRNAGTRAPGWLKVLPYAIQAVGFGANGYYAYHLRKHESQSEAFSAFEQRIRSLEGRFETIYGRPPNAAEKKGIYDEAVKELIQVRENQVKE